MNAKAIENHVLRVRCTEIAPENYLNLIYTKMAPCPLLVAGSTGRRNTPVLKGKDGVYDETSRFFRVLHCGSETGDFGIAGSVRKTLGFEPQQ